MADVDERDAMPVRAPWFALSERFDRRGMGFTGTADPAGKTGRAQARSGCAGGHERAVVCAGDGLFVAASAEGFPAQEHGARLLRSVELGRDVGARSRCPLRCVTRTRGPGASAQRRHYRQPERQIGAKRGASVDPVGYDAGKKTMGIKRHILTDHLGLLLNVVVHPASVQDRDGARQVLTKQLRRRFPFVEVIFADAGYQGPRVRDAACKSGVWRVEIVKRPDAQ